MPVHHKDPFAGKHGNPSIPPPEKKEIPVVEKLLHPEHIARDHPAHVIKHPPVEYKPHVPHRVPLYSSLYGTNGIPDSWEHLIDNYAVGSLTTVAGSQVSTKVTLALSQNWKLEMWPGAINMYLCIRKFSMALQTATLATLGGIDVQFQDIGGQIIPLGNFVSNSSTVSDQTTLIATPLVDPGNPNVGNLLVTLSAGSTVGTYYYQLAFSAAYLIPALRPYELEFQSERFTTANPH